MPPLETLPHFQEKLIKNGRIYFDPKYLPSRNQESVSILTKAIKTHNKNVASNNHTQQNIGRLILALQHVCHQALGTKTIKLFGSSVNGFGTTTSDVDCYVEVSRDGSDNHLCSLLRSLERSTQFIVKDYARSARVPVITVVHRSTKLDCDISFSTPSLNRSDVLINSELLSKYAYLDVRIPGVCRFLKYLIKSSRYGSARSGGLSSYTHTIMLIYFLTHCKEPLIPVLKIDQDICDSLPIQEFSEGDILLDFLQFYSCEFDSSSSTIDITSVATIRRKDQSVRGKFSISDPVITRDLGRYMDSKSTYELKKFYYTLYHQLATHQMDVNHLLDWTRDPVLNKSVEPTVHPHCNPEYTPITRKKKINSKKEAEKKIPDPSPVKKKKEEIQVPVDDRIVDLLGELELGDKRRDRSIPEDKELQRLLNMVDDTKPDVQCLLIVATASMTKLIANIITLCITSFSEKKINVTDCDDAGHVIVGTCQQLLKLTTTTKYHSIHTVFLYSPYEVSAECQGEVFRDMISNIANIHLKVEFLLAYPLDDILDIDIMSDHFNSEWSMKYSNTLKIEEIVELFPPEKTSLRNWFPDIIEIYDFAEKTLEEKEDLNICEEVQDKDVQNLSEPENNDVVKIESLYFEPEESQVRALREVVKTMNEETQRGAEETQRDAVETQKDAVETQRDAADLVREGEDVLKEVTKEMRSVFSPQKKVVYLTDGSFTPHRDRYRRSTNNYNEQPQQYFTYSYGNYNNQPLNCYYNPSPSYRNIYRESDMRYQTNYTHTSNYPISGPSYLTRGEVYRSVPSRRGRRGVYYKTPSYSEPQNEVKYAWRNY